MLTLCLCLECHIVGVVKRLTGHLVLAHVCNVDNRLHCEQGCVVKTSLLVRIKLDLASASSVRKCRVELFVNSKLRCERLVALHSLFCSVNTSLYHLDVREDKLKIYSFKVTKRVDGTVNVDYVVIREATNNVNDSVALANVGKELVSESLAL